MDVSRARACAKRWLCGSCQSSRDLSSVASSGTTNARGAQPLSPSSAVWRWRRAAAGPGGLCEKRLLYLVLTTCVGWDGFWGERTAGRMRMRMRSRSDEDEDEELEEGEWRRGCERGRQSIKLDVCTYLCIGRDSGVEVLRARTLLVGVREESRWQYVPRTTYVTRPYLRNSSHVKSQSSRRLRHQSSRSLEFRDVMVHNADSVAVWPAMRMCAQPARVVYVHHAGETAFLQVSTYYVGTSKEGNCDGHVTAVGAQNVRGRWLAATCMRWCGYVVSSLRRSRFCLTRAVGRACQTRASIYAVAVSAAMASSLEWCFVYLGLLSI